MTERCSRLLKLADEAQAIVDTRAYQLRTAYGIVDENFAHRRYRQAIIRAARLFAAADQLINGSEPLCGRAM